MIYTNKKSIYKTLNVAPQTVDRMIKDGNIFLHVVNGKKIYLMTKQVLFKCAQILDDKQKYANDQRTKDVE